MDATSTTEAPNNAPRVAAPAPTGRVRVPAGVTIRDGDPSRVTQAACRALDLVVALMMLVLLAPLLALIALAIRLDTPGSPVFRQRRVGRDGEWFTINKFRTMYHGASHDSHRHFVTRLISGDPEPQGDADRPFFKIAVDARVTRVGRVLRKFSLDELPQLWNVVMGDMSLVGPRPPVSYEVENYRPEWFGRFAVKPGLTGLWQVSGRSEIPVPEMMQLDLEYARTRSFWLNVRILVRTIPVVLLGRGAA